MPGNDSRFEMLFERHRSRLLAYCMRRGTVDAEDVVAEVFTTAWRRRDDMPGGEQTLPWLYGVTRKVLGHQWRSTTRRLNLRRKAGGRRTVAPLGPEEVVVEHEEHVRVRAAMNLLRPADGEILMLSAWEGLSHAEISSALGISLAAVDKRLVRAKQRLARQFDALEGGSVPRAQRGGGR